MPTIRCILYGDSRVGKTTLLMSHRDNEFPHGVYIPTVFEPELQIGAVEHKRVKGVDYDLILWDYRPDSRYQYPRWLREGEAKPDIFLVLYSSVDLTSFKNIKEIWHPLAALYSAAIVLVATKIDLRQKGDGSAANTISFEQGDALAKEIGAAKYIECSSLTMEGVSECFEECIKASPVYSKDTKCTCSLL